MSFRRNRQLWDSATVADGDPSTDVSVGASTHVAVMIENESGTDATIAVEVAATASSAGGRNGEIAGWFPYSGADALTVPANSKVCVDLSPFAPHDLRLVNNSGGDRDLTAFVATK